MAAVKGRRIGANFERRMIARLGVWWCDDRRALYRSHGSGGRSTQLGAEQGLYSGDVMPVKDSAKPWPFSIELKKSERFTLESILTSKQSLFYQFWKQCVRDAKRSHKIPLLICGKSRREALVFFYGSWEQVLLGTTTHPTLARFYPGGSAQRCVVCLPLCVFEQVAQRQQITRALGQNKEWIDHADSR